MSDPDVLTAANKVHCALKLSRVLNTLLRGVRSPRWTGMCWEVRQDESRPGVFVLSLYELDCDAAGDYEVECYTIATDTTRLQFAGYAKAAMELTIDYIYNYGQEN